MIRPIRHVPFALLLAAAAFAGPYTDTEQSTRLYTKPDPAATGGIRLRLPARGATLAGVFALSQLDQSLCYRAREENGAFVFKGLPVGRYDLMVVYHDIFYENLLLTREPNTLTPADRQNIQDMVDRSVPFFNSKTIHRLEGQTGKGSKAAFVLQDLRTLPITLQTYEVRRDIQIRSLKLAKTEEVNIGWQLIRTREIIRMEVGSDMPKGVLPHKHAPALGNIRVTDSIRDLGELHLP